MLSRLKRTVRTGLILFLPLLTNMSLSAGPAGVGAGLFPALLAGAALPALSLRVPPGEVPFGALFAIEPTIGLRKQRLVYHRVSAQYHIKEQNTIRFGYQPFLRISYSVAIGCGVGYFNEHSTKLSGLTLLPAVEYIFEGLSEFSATFGATIDIKGGTQETNLVLGFHYRGLWEEACTNCGGLIPAW